MGRQSVPDAILAVAHGARGLGQFLELHAQHGCPQFIQTVAPSPQSQVGPVHDQSPILVPRIPKVVTGGDPPRKVIVVRHDAASLARGHVLIHLKAEYPDVAKSPDLLTGNRPAGTLCAVLEQEESPLARQVAYRPDVARGAAYVHHDDAPCSIRYLPDDLRRIQAERIVDVG